MMKTFKDLRAGDMVVQWDPITMYLKVLKVNRIIEKTLRLVTPKDCFFLTMTSLDLQVYSTGTKIFYSDPGYFLEQTPGKLYGILGALQDIRRLFPYE